MPQLPLLEAGDAERRDRASSRRGAAGSTPARSPSPSWPASSSSSSRRDRPRNGRARCSWRRRSCSSATPRSTTASTGSPRRRRCFKRIDHANILLLIAGTYTPISVLGLPPEQAVTILSIVWGGAILGILFRVFWIDAPRWLYVALYLALGWAAVMYLPDLFAANWAMMILVVDRRHPLHGRRGHLRDEAAQPVARALRLPRDLPRLHGARVPLPLDGVPAHRARTRSTPDRGALPVAGCPGRRRRRPSMPRRGLARAAASSASSSRRSPRGSRARRMRRIMSQTSSTTASAMNTIATKPHGPGVTRFGSTVGGRASGVAVDAARASAANAACIGFLVPASV